MQYAAYTSLPISHLPSLQSLLNIPVRVSIFTHINPARAFEFNLWIRVFIKLRQLELIRSTNITFIPFCNIALIISSFLGNLEKRLAMEDYTVSVWKPKERVRVLCKQRQATPTADNVFMNSTLKIKVFINFCWPGSFEKERKKPVIQKRKSCIRFVVLLPFFLPP